MIFMEAGSEEEGVKLLSHTIAQTFEESLEVAGVLTFTYGLLAYLRRFKKELSFELH